MDARGLTTTYGYGPDGRLNITQYPDGTTSTTMYDALGRRIAVTDPFNQTTQYAYYLLGRLSTLTTPGGHVGDLHLRCTRREGLPGRRQRAHDNLCLRPAWASSGEPVA
jgi:YD repeat-containing protein